MTKLVPYIVTAMIAYDLSIHFVYLLKKERFFLDKKLNWWPNWSNWGDKEKASYQKFWNAYWGVAFVLMLFFLFSI